MRASDETGTRNNGFSLPVRKVARRVDWVGEINKNVRKRERRALGVRDAECGRGSSELRSQELSEIEKLLNK